MKRHFVVIALACMLLPGCSHNLGPNKLPIVVNKSELEALKTLIADYRAHPDHVTPETRNNLIDRLIGVSDDHYIGLKDRLLNSRNTLSFLGEVTGTTLSAVSALLGDADTKSIMSTASSLTQSTTTSINKNFFSNSSNGILVGKMDANRAKVLQTITSGESANLGTYGLEAALNDVRRYDDAGTLVSAMLSLSADASTQKNSEENNLRNIQVQKLSTH